MPEQKIIATEKLLPCIFKVETEIVSCYIEICCTLMCALGFHWLLILF